MLIVNETTYPKYNSKDNHSNTRANKTVNIIFRNFILIINNPKKPNHSIKFASSK